MNNEEYEIERLKEIVRTIIFLEERYGGAYEQVLLEKGNPNTTGTGSGQEKGKMEKLFN